MLLFPPPKTFKKYKSKQYGTSTNTKRLDGIKLYLLTCIFQNYRFLKVVWYCNLLQYFFIIFSLCISKYFLPEHLSWLYVFIFMRITSENWAQSKSLCWISREVNQIKFDYLQKTMYFSFNLSTFTSLPVTISVLLWSLPMSLKLESVLGLFFISLENEPKELKNFSNI